ncbi:hypothetical protein AAY473_002699 [Plecturocebus cupreus]
MVAHACNPSTLGGQGRKPLTDSITQQQLQEQNEGESEQRERRRERAHARGSCCTIPLSLGNRVKLKAKNEKKDIRRKEFSADLWRNGSVCVCTREGVSVVTLPPSTAEQKYLLSGECSSSEALLSTNEVPLHVPVPQKFSESKPHSARGDSKILMREDKIPSLGQVRWLMPVIPALWETEAGGSPEIRDSRPACPSWHLPEKTSLTTGKQRPASRYVAQACLTLLASCKPPSLASRSVRITSMSHCTWLHINSYNDIRQMKQCLALSPWLECSGVIMAHHSLHLLGSSNPPISASGVAGTTGMHQYTQLTLLTFSRDKCCPGWSQTPELKVSSFLSHPKRWDYRHEPIQFHKLRTLWETKAGGIRCQEIETILANMMRFHHDGQAGLELLTSGDPPTSTSQSARITGMSHHARLFDFL